METVSSAKLVDTQPLSLFTKFNGIKSSRSHITLGDVYHREIFLILFNNNYESA
jgi:hypothetical protein